MTIVHKYAAIRAGDSARMPNILAWTT